MIVRKENIHENKIKCSNTLQITLDDDFNVPDSKPDIDSIVKERGIIRVDSVKSAAQKAEVVGCLDFALLYTGSSDSNGRHLPVKMQGSMNFNENMNLAENSDNTYVTCNARLEDITVKAINSRKISVKAIVSITVQCEEIEDISMGCEIEETTEEDELQILNNSIDFSQMTVNVKDNLRIKESTVIAAGKPDVAELLWEDVDIRSLNTRMSEDVLNINGQMNIFVMYMAQDENESVQWYETPVAFEGSLDISGCNPDMISYVRYNIVSTNVEVKPDYDGENREIAVEMVLELSVKAYEEREQKILTDIYSPVKNVSVGRNSAMLKHLLIHNNSKCRVSDRIKAADYVNLLQICNCTGTAQIDDITVEDDGLQVDGAIVANVFFITSDDNAPMGSMRAAVPFSHKVQIRNENSRVDKELLSKIAATAEYTDMQEKDKGIEYTVNPMIEDLSAVMTGSNEIEIKGSVSLDTLCFEPYIINAVMSCEVTPFPENEFLKFPSIIGYIANGEDTLWEIAKKNHTTTQSIRNRNSLQNEKMTDDMKIKRGEKLLLVKSARI